MSDKICNINFFAKLKVSQKKMVALVEKLILYPTDVSQWHALVNDAQASTSILLNENTESYLVFLLMRFVKTRKLFESVLALDFLTSEGLLGSKQVTALRDVGDKSLLFCGLFPGMAKKRRVSLEYFTGLGQSAYLSASNLEDNNSRDLFYELSAEFEKLKQILQGMRGNNPFLLEVTKDEYIISGNDIPMQ